MSAAEQQPLKLRSGTVHVSMTSLQFDARVKRTISALRELSIDCVPLAPEAGLQASPMTFWRKLRMALTYPLLARMGKPGARLAFWSFGFNRKALKALISLRPEAIHAHDWDALPIAAAASKSLRVPLIYDSHEYAREMHFERVLWRLTMSRAIGLLEDFYIPQCAGVIAVSDGIADLLAEKSRLANKPVVIRNIPQYANVSAERPSSGDVVLYYHGSLSAGKSIEDIVSALSLLPANYKFRMIGPERQPGFIARITALAKSLSVAGRLEILAAVESDKLVEMASHADIGFCLLSSYSQHNRLALPNKLFEYIMAGLFCVVSSGPEMTKIIKSHSAGMVLDKINAETIAEAVMNITPEKIAQTRRANLRTGLSLNWEHEKARLIELYGRIMPSSKEGAADWRVSRSTAGTESFGQKDR